MLKQPLDRTCYPQDPRSKVAGPWASDGLYVYVRDEHGIIWVLPDGGHLHPKVLGECRLAMYAGDLRIREGIVDQLTNCSGTFQFDDAQGLREVALQLRQQGLNVAPDALRLFDHLAGTRPIRLDFGTATE